MSLDGILDATEVLLQTSSYGDYDTGRSLKKIVENVLSTPPFAIVQYMGFEREGAQFSVGNDWRTWRIRIGILVSVAGKDDNDIENEIVTLADEIVELFENNPTIGGSCFHAHIDSGEQVIPTRWNNVVFAQIPFILRATEEP